MNNERLEYLKNYFASDELVKVQVVIKASISKYFEGERYDYKFRDGYAMVQREDLHYFSVHITQTGLSTIHSKMTRKKVLNNGSYR